MIIGKCCKLTTAETKNELFYERDRLYQRQLRAKGCKNIEINLSYIILQKRDGDVDKMSNNSSTQIKKAESTNRLATPLIQKQATRAKQTYLHLHHRLKAVT